MKKIDNIDWILYCMHLAHIPEKEGRKIMNNIKEVKPMKNTESKSISAEELNRVAIDNLISRVRTLENNNIILTALCNNYAKRSGIKVERFQNGLVIISEIA